MGVKSLLNAFRRARSNRKMRKFCIVEENVQFGGYAGCLEVHDSVTIGHDSYIDCSLFTQNQGRIEIGPYSWIGGEGSTAIGALDNIKIGSHAIISNHVHIYDNNNHPTSPEERLRMCEGGFFNSAWSWEHSASAPITIGNGVWIGEFSMILKGVTIGDGSIVAAHTVVTKDVPPYSVVAGNPGKIVKKLSKTNE